jgi:primosomal protein N' (replication factor Y) (superfamily II helicase)
VTGPDLPAGPVDVCVAVPRLALDRPFTYLLPEGAQAGIGSLVSVPFHGRMVRGWVLGPADEVPPGRLLPVRRVRSPVRFFDPPMLELLRWVATRYVAPLCTVIERSHPPRVAAEERGFGGEPGVGVSVGGDPGAGGEPTPAPAPAGRRPDGLLSPGATTWLRPLPGEEAGACVEAVAACLASGRSAVVVVPEADPVPFTADAVLRRFAGQALAFLGGDARERYRGWLGAAAGRYRVVVGTRPAVFAPVPDLGLVWVAREVHPAHREDRSPYYHVREVAMARAALHGAACVLASLSPSAATVADVDAGRVRARRPPRPVERRRSPLVETAPPEAEDRSVRLTQLLRRAGSAALIVSRRGYGVARVCRSCGQPAACATCRGPIVMARGLAACRVCGAAGRCANCGGGSFGIERGGAERVAEWAAGACAFPVEVAGEEDGNAQGPPGPGRILVGTAAAVKDVGPQRLDLVAILDPDRALSRAGVHAGERALATWMEAAAWAAPREAGGRVLAQTRRAAHPAVQALVRWEPEPFLRAEAAGRTAAGFPPEAGVFRIEGSRRLAEALAGAPHHTLLATAATGGTVCLVAVRPGDIPAFRRRVAGLAADGVVTRVEAEPQL